MEEVHVAEKRLSDYRAIIGSAAFSEILALASKLKGKRVAHVNATAYGGGVAELLNSLVALQRDVGLDAHWFVLAGSNAFFNATKAMHNALQGSETPLSADMLAAYRHFNEVNASTFTDEYEEERESILSRFDVDFERPVISQVGRFDPWKDPLGVIDAYRLVKKKVPGVQLLLVASMARDDPEGWLWFERSARHAGEDPDIHFMTDLRGVGALEVNVLQRETDVSIAKSLREGFGLIVSESLWKSVPVVGGDVGGIRLQVKDWRHGYLVSSV